MTEKMTPEEAEEALRAKGWIKRSLEDRDLIGDTPLIDAARRGAEERVRLMLAARAEVNARNHDGSTALIISTAYDQGTIVKMLLGAGADVDARDSMGSTALIWTAYSNQASLARTLIDANAKLWAQDDLGHTALIECAARNHVNIARSIVEAAVGSDAARKADEIRELHALKMRSTDSVLEENNEWFLIPNPPATGDDKEVVLDFEPFVLVLSPPMKASVLDAQDKDGNTALMWAAKHTRREAVEYLLREGANRHVKNEFDKTALDFAQEVLVKARESRDVAAGRKCEMVVQLLGGTVGPSASKAGLRPAAPLGGKVGAGGAGGEAVGETGGLASEAGAGTKPQGSAEAGQQKSNKREVERFGLD